MTSTRRGAAAPTGAPSAGAATPKRGACTTKWRVASVACLAIFCITGIFVDRTLVSNSWNTIFGAREMNSSNYVGEFQLRGDDAAVAKDPTAIATQSALDIPIYDNTPEGASNTAGIGMGGGFGSVIGGGRGGKMGATGAGKAAVGSEGEATTSSNETEKQNEPESTERGETTPNADPREEGTPPKPIVAEESTPVEVAVEETHEVSGPFPQNVMVIFLPKPKPEEPILHYVHDHKHVEKWTPPEDGIFPEDPVEEYHEETEAEESSHASDPSHDGESSHASDHSHDGSDTTLDVLSESGEVGGETTPDVNEDTAEALERKEELPSVEAKPVPVGNDGSDVIAVTEDATSPMDETAELEFEDPGRRRMTAVSSYLQTLRESLNDVDIGTPQLEGGESGVERIVSFDHVQRFVKQIAHKYVFLTSLPVTITRAELEQLVSKLETAGTDMISVTVNVDGKQHQQCWKLEKEELLWDLHISAETDRAKCHMTAPVVLAKKSFLVSLFDRFGEKHQLLGANDLAANWLSFFLVSSKQNVTLSVTDTNLFVQEAGEHFRSPYTGSNPDIYPHNLAGEQEQGPVHHHLRELGKLLDFRRIYLNVDDDSATQKVLSVGCTTDSDRCDVQKFFFRGLNTPPCCQQKIKEIANFIANFFPTKKWKYWADYSTALSVLRDEGRMIPWDYDADVGVHVNGWDDIFSEASRDEIESYGFYPQREGGHYFGRMFYSKRNGVYMDMYLMSEFEDEEEKDGVVKNTSSGNKEPFPARWIHPTHTCKFADVDNFQCSNDLTGQVIRRYGFDWKTPKRINELDTEVYDHIYFTPRSYNTEEYDSRNGRPTWA